MTTVLRRARDPLGAIEVLPPAPAEAAPTTPPTAADPATWALADTTAPRLIRWRILKRVLDLVVGSVALVIVTPLLLAAALAIALESPGGCLYRQTRVGRDGREFTLCKLRTMTADNDPTAHATYVEALIDGRAGMQDGIYKLARDPRCTRLGRWLRALSIDELPQLLNVLGGQMSLVGPRPGTPAEAGHWDARTRGRLAVKPGMTGLWQVNGRSRMPFDRMVDLDLEYVERGNPILDLGILLRTPFAVLRRETA